MPVSLTRRLVTGALNALDSFTWLGTHVPGAGALASVAGSVVRGVERGVAAAAGTTVRVTVPPGSRGKPGTYWLSPVGTLDTTVDIPNNRCIVRTGDSRRNVFPVAEHAGTRYSNAHMMAMLSKAVYEEQPVFEHWCHEHWGLEFVSAWTLQAPRVSTEAYIVRNRTSVIVCFRGTEPT